VVHRGAMDDKRDGLVHRNECLVFLVSTNGSIQMGMPCKCTQGDDFLDGQPLHSTTYVVVVHVMYNYVPMSRITHVFSVYFMGNCQSHVRI